jgi:rhodanese-related sulfurtransferase
MEYEKSDYIHIYCRSGRRSFQACELMKQMGFENVFNLEDGILDWKGNIVNVN